VRFGAERNTLLLSAETVDRPLVGGNPQLAQLHDQVIVQYLARLDRNDIVQRTRAAILDGLQSGRLSDEQVAGALHLSVRSLQRRLEEGGTNFRRLVDDTRRDVAQAYIRDRNVSLGEIAFLLGFSDASAFSRAYRRWTGKSPTDARAA
jgi:AraC-like DNA-binding protein